MAKKGNGNGGGGGWVALGLLLAFLAGAAIVSKTKSETASCSKCSKPVPINAPMCPWCRTPVFWK